ncbi:hypothetical protein [Shewanella spartinae]|uniref:hypothetical protein n=1 Tax=Shewanella spartinae TaxID=2864205 RepID=UPI001C6560FF|nr:hypothetical protein [Shewanella spartinae]QYJ93553.1 hypothetical protein K0I31_18555 [Shewanella spartinae]
MASHGRILKIGRSIGAISVALFCLLLFPSPAFDACSGENNAFICGYWPDLLTGFLFVSCGYLLGPRTKAHNSILLVLFIFFGSAETIRFSGLSDVFVYAPYQEFYYGGFIAMFLLLLFYVVKDKMAKCT